VRRTASHGGVGVHAVAGTRAVFLGLDLTDAVRGECLGFSISRRETHHRSHWLPGFKTFKSVVPHPDPQVEYSSHDHPMQTFDWSDYTVEPGREYTYRIVPRFGAPGALTEKHGVEASVTVTTGDPAQGVHGIYFNQGVAASQAYAREFGAPPDQLPAEKKAAAMKWLSRGLLEAIVAFIGQAGSNEYALRAAVYEFTQADVLAAFAGAAAAGADVKIVYHALDDEVGNGNRAAIAAAHLGADLLIPRTHTTIAHNKFIVLCRKEPNGELSPVSVWTGSTNLSQGGIFGHSNVGHEVRDPAVAGRYLAFWNELQPDPETVPLRDWVSQNSVFDPDTAGTLGLQTVFSPRHGLDPLRWYSHEFSSAGTAAYLTEAFGMNTLFENDLNAYHGPAVHYVMLDQQDDHQAQWASRRRIFVAVGSKGGPGELVRWAQENLTNFNHYVPYLHTKILLVDPLGSAPLVISGSANFSPNSTSANDENMLVIPGDPEVADVYFTEYARIFNHFYARWWASQLHKDPADAETTSFLTEDASWQDRYFTAGNPKQLQRVLYAPAP
jgi:phosphatidylserine/phosphatidylglycerophosphate/cardiolipin synthase-like enzyme